MEPAYEAKIQLSDEDSELYTKEEDFKVYVDRRLAHMIADGLLKGNIFMKRVHNRLIDGNQVVELRLFNPEYLIEWLRNLRPLMSRSPRRALDETNIMLAKINQLRI